MMYLLRIIVILLGILSIFPQCKENKEAAGPDAAGSGLKEKKYTIVIVYDGAHERESFNIMLDSFKKKIKSELNKEKSRVEYALYFTKNDPVIAKTIVESIKKRGPDLIFTMNNPSAFADIHIAKKLTDPKYRFVSENCIPRRSGVIDSWEKPGGNITGVGIFIQLNSQIRLMKKLNPAAKKLVFFSWNRMVKLNEWFEEEIKKACRNEKIELIEFKRTAHIEDEINFIKKYSNRGKEYFFMGGISAFVHRDGRPVKNIVDAEMKWYRKNVKIPMIVYDETAIMHGMLGGASVIWDDLGEQLAEKGLRVLKGEDPGAIPWEYPRKFDIVLNRKRAEFLKIDIPKNLLQAAYRVYLDYDGTLAEK
jgi:putative ABC transport system substrate-binding protein